jgi:hypothetical protein
VGEFFITQIIAFLGGLLLVYWVSRTALLLRGHHEELNCLLDEDLKMARYIWHQICGLFLLSSMSLR